MCGLFGYMLHESIYDKDKARVLGSVLGYNCTDRGRDSWGVVRLRPGNKYEIQKGLGPIHKGIEYKQFETQHLFGHTRHATMGDVTVENAHPFEMDRIVGMHNGMISNWKPLSEHYKENYPVDSQYLLANIDKFRPISEVSGNGVVVYFDKRDTGRIFIGAGSIHDLEVVVLGDRKTRPLGVIWASRGQYIESALSISEYYKIEHVSISIHREKHYVIRDYEIFDSGDFRLSGLNHAPGEKKYPYQYQGYQGCYVGDSYEGAWHSQNVGSGGVACTDSRQNWKEKLGIGDKLIPHPQSTPTTPEKKEIITSVTTRMDNLGNKSKKKILNYEKLTSYQTKKLLIHLTNVLGVNVKESWLKPLRNVLIRKEQQKQKIGFKIPPLPSLSGGCVENATNTTLPVVISQNSSPEPTSSVISPEIEVGPGGVTVIKNLSTPQQANITREGGEYYDGEIWTDYPES